MKSRVIPTVVSAVALTLALGATVAGRFTEASEPAPQNAAMQFARGAAAWANNCARCHSMRDPRDLRDDQWRAAMAHMRVRAGLTGAEARDILAFLQGSN